MKKIILIFAILSISILNVFSQTKELPYSHQWTVVSGITQPLLLDGFNIAVNYTTNRLVFEYSHGMFLKYNEVVMNPDYKGKVLSIESPYSTGAGIGYRLFANNILAMDIRGEAKVHQYNVELNNDLAIEYTNFDLGAGWYTQVRPFGKKNNALKGIVIEPSIRYWGNAASTLENDFQYTTNEDDVEIHKPYALNLFANISIGYTFGR